MKERLGETPYLPLQRSVFIMCRLVQFWGNFPRRPMLEYRWLITLYW